MKVKMFKGANKLKIKPIHKRIAKTVVIAFMVTTVLASLLSTIISSFKATEAIRGLENKLNEFATTIEQQNEMIEGYKIQIEEKDKEISRLNEKVQSMDKELKQFKKETEENLQQYAAVKKAQTINSAVYVTANRPDQPLTIYTNLVTDNPLSVEELDMIIDYMRPRILDGRGTQFTGEMFYRAWEVTGIDPRYLLAHSANESGWGNYHHGDKYQVFGIGVWDTNPEYAIDMGNCMADGVINGARWIKEKYYDKGAVTLDLMGRSGYATYPGWTQIIANLANSLTTVLTKARTEQSVLA